MGELIYRDVAVAAISAQMRGRGIDPREKVGLNNAKITIQSLAAVDAAPVKRGQWIYYNCVGQGRYQCSECMHWVDAGLDRNYCPNCGAVMRGEENAID